MRTIASFLYPLIALMAGTAQAQDARKWAEAGATHQKFAASKDPSERATAAKVLGEATSEKTDKVCFQIVGAHLRTELNRENDGKNEERVSGLVLEACVEALRKITQKEAVDLMMKAAKNKGDSPRFRAHLIWALSTHGDLKDLAELVDDKQPHVQIAALDALTERADASSVDLFLKVVRDEKRTWEAKLAALKGVARAADDKVVETLIDSLGKVKIDEGRLKDEYLRILKKLVGTELESDDPNAWKSAWALKKAGKDPEKPGEGNTVSIPTEFFGLKTKSTRIVFILDRTGSMASPLKYQEEPKKEPEKKPEVATAGGANGKKESPQDVAFRDEAAKIKKKYDEKKVETRMDALKKEFINTLWKLNEKIWFGVVFYEGNHQPWKDHLVPATWANKLEAMRETDKLMPSGPTNIWGGLEHAFRYVEQPQRPDIMQVDKKGNYATLLAGADTFYLMTDGAHNTGKFINEKATSPLDVCDAAAFIAEIRKIQRIRKVIINTICLGSEAKDPGLLPEPKLMQKIAEETGGEFTQIKG
jgi:hypothetical protein